VLVGSENGKDLMLVEVEPDRNHSGHVVAVAVRLDDKFRASLKELLQGEVDLTWGGHDLGPRMSAVGYPAVSMEGATQLMNLPFRTVNNRPVFVRVRVPAEDILRSEHRAVAFSITGGTALLALALLLYGWTVERSLRDTQARLVHSAKLSTVGQLVAGVSHELNNPLLGLIGSAEQLSDTVREGDAGRPFLDLILKEAHRLKRTLADLRGFVRPSNTDRVTLDLAPLLRDVVGLVRHQATEAHVTCENTLTDGAAIVSGSSDQLRQVFLNLAVNAVEAMPNGGTLRIGASRNGANRVAVTIADSGPGLVGDAQHRATEPFFSTKPGRLGLGLAITRDIVEAHGGRFTLNPAAAGGTVATVEFPGIAA